MAGLVMIGKAEIGNLKLEMERGELGGMSGEFAVQELAEFLDGHVHDEAHIADAEAGDFGDLLVGAVVHELEPNDFFLIGAELFHEVPDTLVQLMGDGVFTRVGIKADGHVEHVFIAEIEPVILAQDIERTVPADGEKPGLEVVADLVGVGEVELEHGVLHDLSRALDVTIEDARRVGDEVALMLIQRPPDEQGGFFGLGLVGEHEYTVRPLKRFGKEKIRDGSRLPDHWLCHHS